MKIRIGTFSCWLFGHKFFLKIKRDEDDGYRYITFHRKDFCTRCGISKPKEGGI